MIEISIDLDHADVTYAAGSYVCGRLDLRNLDDRVRDAEVFLEWRTTDSDPQRARCAAQRVSIAGLALGGRARPAFKLKLPDAPVSYAGTLFSVEWYLVARVDVAWARDPQLERRLDVVGRGPALRETKRTVDVAIGRSRPRRRGVTRPLSRRASDLMTSLIAPGILGAVVTEIGVSLGGALAVTGAAFALAGGAAVLGYRRWTRNAAIRAFGGPSFSMNADEPQLGEPLHVRVAMKPPQALKAVRVQYRLVAQEAIVVPNKKQRIVRTHEVHSSLGLIGSDATLAGAQVFEGIVPIPDSRAASFDAPDHAVFWQLGLELTAILGQATVVLRDELELTVRPARSRL